MNDIAPLSAVEVLVLTRLLPVGEKGETKAKMQKDLEPLLGHRWSGSVLTNVLDRTLIKLVSKGLVMSPSTRSRARKAVPAGRAEPPDGTAQQILEFSSRVEAASHEARRPTWAEAQELAAPGPCARASGVLALRSPRTTGFRCRIQGSLMKQLRLVARTTTPP